VGDSNYHAKISQENMEGAIEELEKKRFTNVAILTLRALEQMVEACAAKQGLNFHEHPRTAHINRRSWLRTHHPDLLEIWDELWGIYGALGYGGLNGERAEEAVTGLKKALMELGRRERIAIKGL
jgi:hypothetical protein